MEMVEVEVMDEKNRRFVEVMERVSLVFFLFGGNQDVFCFSSKKIQFQLKGFGSVCNLILM